MSAWPQFSQADAAEPCRLDSFPASHRRYVLDIVIPQPWRALFALKSLYCHWLPRLARLPIAVRALAATHGLVDISRSCSRSRSRSRSLSQSLSCSPSRVQFQIPFPLPFLLPCIVLSSVPLG